MDRPSDRNRSAFWPTDGPCHILVVGARISCSSTGSTTSGVMPSGAAGSHESGRAHEVARPTVFAFAPELRIFRSRQFRCYGLRSHLARRATPPRSVRGKPIDAATRESSRTLVINNEIFARVSLRAHARLLLSRRFHTTTRPAWVLRGLIAHQARAPAS